MFEYFAAQTGNKAGKAIVGRLERLLEFKGGNTAKYEQSYAHLFSVDNGAGVTMGVTRKGRHGEVAAFRVNRARRYLKALLSLIGSQGLSFRCQALQYTEGAMAAASLGNNVLEAERKTKHLDDVLDEVIELAGGFSRGILFCKWDENAGRELFADSNDVTYRSGGMAYHVIPPWHHFVDPRLTSPKDICWQYFVRFENTANVASEHPELANKILQSTTRGEVASLMSQGDFAWGADEEGMTPVWYFFHAPTPAMPVGREVQFVSSDCVLVDRPLLAEAGGRYPRCVIPSDSVPVVMADFEKMFNSPMAWTSFWDALGAQEILDALDSCVATILTNAGHMIYAVERGSDQNPQKLAKAFSTWTYNPGGKIPASVNLAKLPEGIMQAKEMLIQDMQGTFNLNDVALGQPKGAQMNAQAFAVLASMATQLAQPLQRMRVSTWQRVGTLAIKTMAVNVKTQESLRISLPGASSTYSEQKWSGKDLEAVDDVYVDAGNPAEQTHAGRMALLETLSAIPGCVPNQRQAIAVMETGRLEPATVATERLCDLVRAENEALCRGETPPVHPLDDHKFHWMENKSELDVKANRDNPEVIRAVQEHLDAHYFAAFGVDRLSDPLRRAREAWLSGVEVGPAPANPQVPEQDPAAAVEMAAGRVKLPINPATGEQFSPGGQPPA